MVTGNSFVHALGYAREIDHDANSFPLFARSPGTGRTETGMISGYLDGEEINEFLLGLLSAILRHAAVLWMQIGCNFIKGTLHRITYGHSPIVLRSAYRRITLVTQLFTISPITVPTNHG